MKKDLDQNQRKSVKIAVQRPKKECFSTMSNKDRNNMKSSFHLSDWQTKASSGISGGPHEHSFDFSESSFQNEQLKAEDFFKDELILQRKVIKKQLCLKQQCFTPEFTKHVTDILTKFTSQPTNNCFQIMLHQLKLPDIKIFHSQQLKYSPTSSKLFTFKQVMESLIFQRKNWFFIYTFDLLVCHLTFFIVLMTYWVQTESSILKKPSNFEGKNVQGSQILTEISTKHNIMSIVKAYIKSHPQQINQNQVLFLLVLFFLDALKNSNPSQSESLVNIQKQLAQDIKNLRKRQKRERNFFKSNQDFNVQSKIIKYEESHQFILQPQQTFQMIRSHILENLSTELITKYYESDNESRKSYQFKKDTFCLWVLETIIKQDQKSSLILKNAAMFIVQLLGMLKKFKKQNNIQGISYLIPIVANLKMLLPKVWRHVVKRRPQIQIKLSQYGDFMLKNKFHIQQLGSEGVIWGQTIFTIAQRMVKFISHKKGINLVQHQKFYDQFLSQIFYYRHRAKQIVGEPTFELSSQIQSTLGFNLTSLQSFLVKKYTKHGLVQCWNELTRKADKINQSISESVVADIFDYWFVGSTQKYKKVDL